MGLILMKKMLNIALAAFLVLNLAAQDSVSQKQHMLERVFSDKITRVTAENHPHIYGYVQFVVDLSNSIPDTSHLSELPIFIISQQGCMRRCIQKVLANIEAAIIIPEEALHNSSDNLYAMIARQIGYIKYGYAKKMSASLLGTGIVSIASTIYFWPSMTDASAIEKFSMKLTGLATGAFSLAFVAHADIARKVDFFVEIVQIQSMIAQQAVMNQFINESSDLHTTA